MSNNLAKFDILLTHGFIAKDTGHKLIIQTAAGQYIGELYDPDNADYPYVSAIAQKIKDESNYLGKSVYCFFGAIALFAYVCIYLGLVGLTLMIIIK